MQPLRVNGLSITLPGGELLVEGLSFTVEPGEILALMGPSGSGKSSILAWLTGTASSRLVTTGDVWLGDRCMTLLPVEQRRLGLMLQQDYLFPHMNVRDNLLFGIRGGTRSERLEKVRQSLEDAGLDTMGLRSPDTLSGGQRARVSLVRTLLSDPYALLLDEPFSGLDVAMREQIRRFTWHRAANLPVLLVTHDVSDVPQGARILDIGSATTNGITDA